MIFNISKSYEDMLNKIGIFTWGFLIVSWYLIILSFPEFNQYINKFIKESFEIKSSITILGFELPFSFVIPTAISIICRIIKLHDRVSDIMDIRLNYDCYNILAPLVEGSGSSIRSLKKIKENRTDLMGKTFYKYAGYISPVIDEHLINMALDSLCWYWIIVEGLVVTLTTFIICIFSSKLDIIRMLFLIIIILIIACLGLRNACRKRTSLEVNAILDDVTRKNEIKAVFDAL